jgi:amidase
MPAFPEYDRLDASGLAGLVRQGEIHPAELLDAAIERIEALNPPLNAVVARCYDRARQQARNQLPDGPFRGVPFLLKDMLAIDGGTCTTNGCRFFQGHAPARDSELVRRLKAAGLLIVGKTNTSELGILPVTEPRLYGPTRNPWNTAFTPGGSSGGSAAAVAAGMVPMAHGGDGGGSIRIPAACCGVFGLKPTRGRNPMGPYVGEGWHGIVVEHALTRSVRDSATLLDATQGPDVGAPYVAPPPERPYRDEVGRDPGRLRIAFTTESLLGSRVHPDCVAAVKHVAALCEKLGHHVEEDAPSLDRRALCKAYLTLIAAETAAMIELASETMGGKKPRAREFEPGSWMLAQIGRKFRADELAVAVHRVHAAGRELGAWFDVRDALLTPTLSAPPLLVGALDQKPIEKLALAVLRALPSETLLRKLLDRLAVESFEYAAFTPVANLTGQPAMSVPLYWNDQGLPIGCHFFGRFGDEAALLRLASQLEQAQPWAGRRPPFMAASIEGAHARGSPERRAAPLDPCHPAP